MISTVTTAVSTIVSSTTAANLMVSLGIAGALTLLATLVVKELTAARGVKVRLLHSNLDIITLPLFFVFAFMVVTNIVKILS